MIDEKYLSELKTSGNWMIRNSKDGLGYGDFQWAPVGEWTVCPKWTAEETCDSGGLFGQGPGGYGHMGGGTRFELCETDAIRITIDGEKIKTPRAKIIAVNQEAFDALMFLCDGKFDGTLVVPSGVNIDAPVLTKADSVNVREGATFTAPALTSVTGSVNVYENATFTAPVLTKAGYVYFYENATFTAPALTSVNGSVNVREGATFTAPALTSVNGYVNVYENATFTAPALASANRR